MEPNIDRSRGFPADDEAVIARLFQFIREETSATGFGIDVRQGGFEEHAVSAGGWNVGGGKGPGHHDEGIPFAQGIRIAVGLIHQKLRSKAAAAHILGKELFVKGDFDVPLLSELDRKYLFMVSLHRDIFLPDYMKLS